MGNSVSIKDVAQKAGVSPTTVSRVINDSEHPVNEKTREKVEQAIRKLNYQPNRLAQGLKNNRSMIIGVIVHDISDSYFAQIVSGIENITFEHDYIVNIINTERDINKELKAVNMLKANRAEAVVFTGGNLIDDYYFKNMKKHIQDLKNQKSCILGVTAHPFDFKNIELGNKKAAFLATEYLINNNHQHIAYIDGPKILNTSRERLKGYEQGLRKHNIAINRDLILKGDFTFEGGRKAALNIINSSKEMTAVVASNDETALGLMWELRRNEIDIPQEISVIGIGNIPSSRYSNPPLTTIALPLYNLGQKIGQYLMGQLNSEIDKVKSRDINIEIEITERDSIQEM